MRQRALAEVKPWGAWGRIGETPVPAPTRPVPAIVALFEEYEQLHLFDPGEIPWIVPKMLNGRQVVEHGELMYELNWQVAAVWNARWAGKKVRILTPDSGVTEGYCGGVGDEFFGPCVTINRTPGARLCCDPRAVIRIREIDYFDGEEKFNYEGDDGEGLAEDQGHRADGGEAGAALHERAA